MPFVIIIPMLVIVAAGGIYTCYRMYRIRKANKAMMAERVKNGLPPYAYSPYAYSPYVYGPVI